METRNFEIENTKSNIDWTGRKVTGSHHGTISIQKGILNLNNGKLSGGKFVIDTTSIQILDVTDPATNAQFAGHLASEDFFNSKEFPEAVLVITAVAPDSDNTTHIDADLTIKDISHPVKFNAQIDYADDTVTATGKIVIDRTKYGMKFRSGNFFKDLGDTMIYNEFDLNVKITAKKL
ncbi:YceI family protein [Pedobacter cryoconitis]|uniref:Polyisoprenoid-binding protein YceI n=1 Tax=Pedobacter cryoconitis TaxID=188932 RepID=A0A7X0MGR5_9SPHI|nr:YceI family protein [Pedobacter cryoconitis]MBB6498349.1 polyisoprenoid-binding protein YceI [Pedobacter cryoconitis]